ncbi:MAG: PRC-barrel domain-containing protein [Methanococcaceae archaeon]
MDSEKKLLYKLSDLDYFEVSDEDPDVRGWDVFGSDGEKLGTVDELIIAPAEAKVRYLDVLLNYTAMPQEFDGRHILVPIGTASVNEKDDKVILKTINRKNIYEFPPYDGGNVTRIYENSIRKIMEPDILITSDESGDFYSHEHFDENMFYADRRRRAGL